MKIKCNACGAETSLDAVIDNDDAATALSLALSMTPLGKLLVRYLAMFRPAKTRLTWDKVASILGELLPMIESERIERKGRVYEVPNHVWCNAIEKALQARDAGTLTLPLKSHGYLFEIMVTESAREHVNGLVAADSMPAASQKQGSNTANAISILQSRKRS